MIDRGDKVIVAVSGGPDSIFLLDGLNRLSHEMGISLVVAHYDHGLRGDEDKFETKLVKDAARLMVIPFETEKASKHLKSSSSLEEKSREARYAFLERIRIKHKAQKIAVGHNLNDQAETVLMRLLRGSGPSGLAGIPPVRDNVIIRPLIEITREEIKNYLKDRGIHFAIDSSNINIRHLRNRIRLELIPIMLEYQPKLLERLARFSDILRDEDTFLDSIASEWIENVSEKADNGNISVPVSSVKNLPGPLKNRVIRKLLKQVDGNIYSLEYDHVISVIELLDNEHPQCSVDLPNGIMVRKAYQSLQFALKPQTEAIKYNYSLEGPGTYQLAATGQTLTIEETERAPEIPEAGDSFTAYLDADKLQHPLIARNFKPGDRFVPLGMKGHKKVKNFFIDLKVPSEKRVLTPILTSGDKIVWICGYRIDNRFKVTERTKRILKVSIINTNLLLKKFKVHS